MHPKRQATMSGLLNKLKKNKTPEQLVAAMVEALDQGQDAQLAKRLSQIKFVLYGEEERDPDEARCVMGVQHQQHQPARFLLHHFGGTFFCLLWYEYVHHNCRAQD